MFDCARENVLYADGVCVETFLVRQPQPKPQPQKQIVDHLFTNDKDVRKELPYYWKI